jgi:hypothetical protein
MQVSRAAGCEKIEKIFTPTFLLPLKGEEIIFEAVEFRTLHCINAPLGSDFKIDLSVPSPLGGEGSSRSSF